MITRFRVEAEGRDKDLLTDEITGVVTQIISTLDKEGFQPLAGEWECTDDVISGNGHGYKARMVMKFHPENEALAERLNVT